MNDLYEKSPGPAAGTSTGGSSYHLSFRSGSRGSGSCAHASYGYIMREGEYAEDDRDPAIHTESDHMPSWAEDDASEYWDGPTCASARMGACTSARTSPFLAT